MDIIRRIRQEYTNLSKTQRRIADYLLENSNIVAFMTLKAMSEEVNAAEVTILKFCKKIGCNNFMELKRDFQTYVNQYNRQSERLTNVLENMESIDNNLAEIMTSEIRTVEDAIKKIGVEDIKEATKLIKQADKVYLVSNGISDAVSQFLLLRLKYLGINVEKFDINSYHLFSFSMSVKTKNSVFIVTTLPTYTKSIAKFTKYLKEKEHKIIAFSDSTKSPIARYADVLFTCDTESVLFFNTITGLISISNILVTSLAIESKEKILENMKELQGLEDTFFD